MQAFCSFSPVHMDGRPPRSNVQGHPDPAPTGHDMSFPGDVLMLTHTCRIVPAAAVQGPQGHSQPRRSLVVGGFLSSGRIHMSHLMRVGHVGLFCHAAFFWYLKHHLLVRHAILPSLGKIEEACWWAGVVDVFSRTQSVHSPCDAGWRSPQ